MRIVFSLLFIATIWVGETAFGEDRGSPLEPIAGYELRLLDRKLPVEITEKEQTEKKEMPVWLFMPVRGARDQTCQIEEITQADDLSTGTALLPPPPAGYGLRALKLPLRETTVLGSGRPLIVEVPVFIYFRRILPPLEKSIPTNSSAASPIPVGTAEQSPHLLDENQMLRAELVALNQEFELLVGIMPDGTAKERLKLLVRRVATLSAASPVIASTASTADSNIP